MTRQLGRQLGACQIGLHAAGELCLNGGARGLDHHAGWLGERCACRLACLPPQRLHSAASSCMINSLHHLIIVWTCTEGRPFQ